MTKKYCVNCKYFVHVETALLNEYDVCCNPNNTTIINTAVEKYYKRGDPNKLNANNDCQFYKYGPDRSLFYRTILAIIIMFVLYCFMVMTTVH